MEEVIPYYAFLGIVMVTFARQNKSKNAGFNIYTIITLVAMVLFAGLRDISVGTDTGAYVNMFNNLDTALYGSTKDILLSEPGYFLLEHVARIFSSNYWALLTTIAAVCYFLVMRSILKYSQNRLFSLFIFITLGYYTFCFNAARQALALSIYLLAIPCVMQRRFWRYSLIVLVAAMFHKTVIIALPLYFLFKMRFSVKSLILVMTAGFGISLILPFLLDAATEVDEKYELYAKLRAVGGYLLTAFYVMMSVFCIFMRRKICESDRENYDIFLQMLICGTVIYMVVSLSGVYVELTRFAAYFQIATIFLFGMLFRTDGPRRPVLKVVIVAGTLVFFFIFITTMARLVPYEINTSL